MDARQTKKTIDGLKKGEEIITGLIVLGVTLFLFINAVLRYGFNSSLSWAEEFIRYVMIWISFIGATIAFRNESHFGVDLIFRLKSVKLVKMVRLINDLGCFIFCGFVAYYGFKMVTFNMGTAQTSPALQIALWKVYSVIPLSGAVSMLYILRNFIRKVKTPAEVLHVLNNTNRNGDEPVL